MNKKANKKNIARRFLVAGFFVLLVFVSLLDSSPANAVVNDYYKNATSTLTATEWNNLLLDFLNTGGGRVNGSVGINTATSSSYILNVSGGGYFSQPVVVGTPTDVSHAATMGYINSVITGGSGSTVGYWAMNGTNINNTNSGNVGIGTTTPVYKLDVAGTLRVTENAFFDRATYIKDFNGTIDSWWGWYTWDKEFQFNKRTSANAFVQNIFTANWDTGNFIMVPSAGNVGIGTTTPAYKLDVAGTFRAADNAYFDKATFIKDYNGAIESWWGWYAWDKEFQFNKINSSNVFVQNIFTANWDTGNFIMVPSSGSVGIGNTAPGTKLDVTGSFRNSLATTHTLLGSAGNVVVMADNTGTLYSTPLATFVSSNSLDLWEGAKNGNIWNGDAGAGNVGIGTTAPNQKLDVYGNITTFGKSPASFFPNGAIVAYNPTGDSIYGSGMSVLAKESSFGGFTVGYETSAPNKWLMGISNGITDRTGLGIFEDSQAAKPRFFIATGGNVGIGITNPGAKLDVVGSLRNSLATTHTLLGGAGNVVVMADNTGTLYSTSTASFISGNSLDLWKGTKNGNIWNGDAGVGNVGIGTTNPLARLDINAGDNIGLKLTAIGSSDNVGTGIRFGYNQNVLTNDYFLGKIDAIKRAGGGGDLILNSASSAVAYNSNQLVLAKNGNVGVNVVSPAEKLEIAGALKLANTTSVCNKTRTGTFKYDSTSGQSYLCDGTRWLNQKNCGVMTDDEGYTYGTVQIGGQCWMAENINIGTMLVAGTTEPVTTDNIIEKWCYNNDTNNCTLYGGLYNWNEAMRGSQVSGARGICADGWHIPTDAEYNTLEKTVLGLIASPNAQYACNMSVSGWQRCADNSGTDTGGTYGVGKSLKTVGVGSGVGAGNDLVGFAGKLSGYRYTDGSFYYLGSYLLLWSSTPSGSSNAWRRTLLTTYSTVYRSTYYRAYGFSVRCLRD